MQFCNINEAWGNDEYISEHYTSNIQRNLKEHFSPLVNDIQLSRNYSKNKKNTLMTCDQIIAHFLYCPKCSRTLREKLFGSFYNNIRNTIDNYREPITLVLITLFIILIINLVIKMD